MLIRIDRCFFAPVFLLAFACGGSTEDGPSVPLDDQQSKQRIVSGTRECPREKCENQAGACFSGTPTNMRCEPSPWAGQGSLPHDACVLAFECE